MLENNSVFLVESTGLLMTWFFMCGAFLTLMKMDYVYFRLKKYLIKLMLEIKKKQKR